MNKESQQAVLVFFFLCIITIAMAALTMLTSELFVAILIIEFMLMELARFLYASNKTRIDWDIYFLIFLAGVAVILITVIIYIGFFL